MVPESASTRPRPPLWDRILGWLIGLGCVAFVITGIYCTSEDAKHQEEVRLQAEREAAALAARSPEEVAAAKQQSEQLQRERIEREKAAQREENVASTLRLSAQMFFALNPQTTLINDSYRTAVTADGHKIEMSFEYSIVNAFGASAVHRRTLIWSYELTEVLDEQDEFLYWTK
jgi:hypothetical protein